MNRITIILMIAILAGLATWFLPWWMIAAVPFLVVVFFNVPKPFWLGFFGIALLWTIWILVTDMRNEHILSSRMATLFGLPHYAWLIFVNVLLGGLIGGLSAYSAGRMNRSFRKR